MRRALQSVARVLMSLALVLALAPVATVSGQPQPEARAGMDYAPGAVLVGLSPRASLMGGANGLQTTDAGLSAALAGIGAT